MLLNKHRETYFSHLGIKKNSCQFNCWIRWLLFPILCRLVLLPSRINLNYLSLSPYIKLLLVLTRWSFIPLIHILQKVTFLRICHTNIKLWLLHGNFAIEISSQKPNWKQSIVTLVALKRPSSQTALTPVVLHLCTHNSLQTYLSLWVHRCSHLCSRL